MNRLRVLAGYSVLVIVGLFLNILIWVGLNDGRPVDRMLSSTAYFGLLAGLLFLAVRSCSSKRNRYLFLLLLVFPCVYIDILEYAIDPLQGTSPIGAKIEVGEWFGSLWSLWMYFYHRMTDVNVRSYNPKFGYQMYSLGIDVALMIILLHFKNIVLDLYRKRSIWLTVPVFIAGYLLITGYQFADQLSGNFLLVYLLAYGLLLFTYTVLQKRTSAKQQKLLLFALLLLFPTVSILPGTYNMITTDTSPYYLGTIGVAPLASAVPFTLKQLVVDISAEKQLWPFSMKLYTLLQACVVLFALPSALLHKTEQNG